MTSSNITPYISDPDLKKKDRSLTEPAIREVRYLSFERSFIRLFLSKITAVNLFQISLGNSMLYCIEVYI